MMPWDMTSLESGCAAGVFVSTQFTPKSHREEVMIEVRNVAHPVSHIDDIGDDVGHPATMKQSNTNYNKLQYKIAQNKRSD
jgi:hypothetical protein